MFPPIFFGENIQVVHWLFLASRYANSVEDVVQEMNKDDLTGIQCLSLSHDQCQKSVISKLGNFTSRLSSSLELLPKYV